MLQLDIIRNFAKNSFKSDVALKHAQDEVPARKAPQKSRNRRPRRANGRKRQKRRTFRPKNTVLCSSQEIDSTIVPETRVPDVCLSILVVSCVVTSVSAGSRGQFLPK